MARNLGSQGVSSRNTHVLHTLHMLHTRGQHREKKIRGGLDRGAEGCSEREVSQWPGEARPSAEASASTALEGSRGDRATAREPTALPQLRPDP